MSTPTLQLVPNTGSNPAVTAPNSKNTSSLSITANVLGHHPAWQGVIALDEFAQRIVFRKLPPFESDYAPAAYRAGQALRDPDVSRMQVWLDREYGKAVRDDTMWKAITLVADNNKYHPVREYLEQLQWDGTPRVESWLEQYAKVVPTSDDQARLVHAVAKRFLISCVARAMKPGCQVDTMLILEGAQGIGKSRGLEALAGPEFFCNTALDLGSKDAFQNVQGVWIYELAELDSLLRAESSQAKGFLSGSKDKFRAPYGRAPDEAQRGVVFCGTVNHDAYLKDLSGNRRYWTIRCEGKIDRTGIAAMRDQLWAEAVALYKQGEQWHLTDDEDLLMREEQAEREPEHLWLVAIEKWAAAEPANAPHSSQCLVSPRNDDQPFSLAQVWDGMQQYIPGGTRAPQKYNAPVLSSLLVKLGYEKKRVMTADGKKPRLYAKK